MSWNRENVIWQSADGTWSRGFYECHESNRDDDEEDFDPEWDVEYDFDRLEWASIGHKTADLAYASWDGQNPGGSTTMAYTEHNRSQCDELDKMARELLDSQRALSRKSLAFRY